MTFEPSPILFTKPDCPRCERLKIALNGCTKYSSIDVSTVDGMAEACMYGVYHETMPVALVFFEGRSQVLTSSGDILSAILGYDVAVRYDEELEKRESCTDSCKI